MLYYQTSTKWMRLNLRLIQLEAYIRAAFTGQHDVDFLPPHSHFWRGHSISGGGDRGSLSVGDYFGSQIYHMFYDSVIGFSPRSSSASSQTPIRFLNILEKILHECIGYQGIPDERQLIMTQSAIDTVGAIRFNERPDLGINYPPEHRRLFDLAKAIKLDPRYQGLYTPLL